MTFEELVFIQHPLGRSLQLKRASVSFKHNGYTASVLSTPMLRGFHVAWWYADRELEMAGVACLTEEEVTQRLAEVASLSPPKADA